jgi:hypothetical protein
MLALAAVCTTAVLLADRRALAHARAVSGVDLVAHDPTTATEPDAEARSVDLGLGAEVLAKVARGAAAYRDRARTVALVRGTPDRAFEALAWAIARSKIALGAMALIGVAHAVAMTPDAGRRYLVTLCGPHERTACLAAAAAIEPFDPAAAAGLRRRWSGWPFVD